jgi:FkbM family methyltransferase
LDGVEELQVEMLTLESALVAHGPVGFDPLKVDVEGSEADVLA